MIPLLPLAFEETAAFTKPGVLNGIAAILSAIAWPVLAGVLLYWMRRPLEQLITSAVGIAASSSKFKIGQVIEFERDVQIQVDNSEHEARSRQLSVSDQQLVSPVPQGEVEAAARVRSLVDQAGPGTLRQEVQESIRLRILGFAKEYETTRAAMPAGADRTRAMNAVAAKMRTLALAAEPFLDELADDTTSPGKRLAAVCILQLAPQLSRIDWLADRMAADQPFVFFHASGALLSAVRKYGAQQRAVLRAAIDRALAQVESYGDQRDKNTVRTLTLALSELETSGS